MTTAPTTAETPAQTIARIRAEHAAVAEQIRQYADAENDGTASVKDAEAMYDAKESCYDLLGELLSAVEATAAHTEFVEKLAAWTLDGETPPAALADTLDEDHLDSDGDYIMENDEAWETVHSFVNEARELLGTATD